jgi:ParB family chromosome partitioning protein
MDDLVESIKKNGVLTPVIVRPDDEGTYEMISGHRRLHAAKRAGLATIPAIVKPMTDDEAIVAMVDSNVQREEILPSERAFALKMKMDAIKRQGARTDLDVTSTHNERRLETADVVGEQSGISRAQVRRYIRLTELNSNLLEMVDNKKLQLMLAVDISYFDKDIQQWIYEYIKENVVIKPEQIKALKECTNLDNITQYTMIQIMNDALPKKVPGKVSLSEKKLSKYFPSHMPSQEREKIILQLLEKWHQEQEDEV